MQITFNSYGFIIGVAIVVGLILIEKRVQKNKLQLLVFQKTSVVALLFGVIMARLWHVVTDFSLYADNLLDIFAVWNGGLSIIGAFLGGAVGICVSLLVLKETKMLALKHKWKLFLELLDASIFGLPIAQAIGRFANFFNQELYGLPTNRFFKIFIDEQHRLPGFESTSYYHPLFLYEAFFTASFALWLYIFSRNKQKIEPTNSGSLFLLYTAYYSSVRLLLDPLRLHSSPLNKWLFMSVVVVISLYFLWQKLRTLYIHEKK